MFEVEVSSNDFFSPFSALLRAVISKCVLNSCGRMHKIIIVLAT